MTKTIREVISTLYKSPMRDMSYVSYFKYLNEAGKITARSLMDGLIIAYTFIEILETKNAIYEADFKEIEEILTKLTALKEKAEKKIVVEEPSFIASIPTVIASEPLQCEECGKVFKIKLALAGHKRSHKSVV